MSLIAKVAVAAPLRKVFDYTVPPALANKLSRPGMRVEIEFGRKKMVGIVIEYASHSDITLQNLKPILRVFDDAPVLDAFFLGWLGWMSLYYHAPIGEALFTALPNLCKQAKPLAQKQEPFWQLTAQGLALDTNQLKRAAKQVAVINFLKRHPEGRAQSQIAAEIDNAHSALKALSGKMLIERIHASSEIPIEYAISEAPFSATLNDTQLFAAEEIAKTLGGYCSFLLEGVTGSGKTEVYLKVIALTCDRQQQALVLVPEIGLTPQFIARFKHHFGERVVSFHSHMTDHERLAIWQRVQREKNLVVIGTRSAIFLPLCALGIIVVDEEHDLSYKQQDGLRYSARDMAIVRAQRQEVPVILGSATPSLESLHNVQTNRYRLLELPLRAGLAVPPKISAINICGQPMHENLSMHLLKRIKQHLQRQEQVLIFLNRRGYAPLSMCHKCGWTAICKRCDRPMTLHLADNRLRCHHCGADRKAYDTCPDCKSTEIKPKGFGTERVEKILHDYFPDTDVIRVDRDTTRRKGSMEKLFEKVRSGSNQILLGTQMLAKGHDFPNLTLVAVLDADQGLFGSDPRSSERLAQLIIQVAGRAGRADKQGHVVIQTHHPDNPMLKTLIEGGYPAFASLALAERKATLLPPYTFAAVFRAEATVTSLPMEFLSDVKHAIGLQPNLDCLGPIPSVMEKKAGKFRAQLLLLHDNRKQLQALLAHTINQIESWKQAKKVRWTLDVDPQEMM